MTQRTVYHLGPDPAFVGGMGSVLRTLDEHDIGGTVHVVPTWQPGALGMLRVAARAAATILRLPSDAVVHVHLSENGSFVREGALLALARRRGLLAATTIHGAEFAPFAQAHPRLVGHVLRHARLITCLNEEALAIARTVAPAALSVLMPNPTTIDDGSPPADTTPEVVLFTGEIGRRKGADVLAEAWADVAARRPAARCIVVGPPGDYTPHPAERLELRPPVGPAEIRALLRDARVVALPSRAEGQPMTLTEAMAAGRPFVSTPVGGIPELARDGGGVLVDVGDATALAEALVALLADPARAREIGEAGRAHVTATRSPAAIDARLRELYDEAAARRG